MTGFDLIAHLTLTQKRQRVAYVCASAPFYFAFTVGWIWRLPIPFGIGLAGWATTTLIYRRFAKSHSSG